MKKFNSTGLCVPRKHYMVDISDRVKQIRAMVNDGDYLCINRARQYGKTTMLAALKRALQDEYVVVSLDFQGLSHADFESEPAFSAAFARELLVRRDYGMLDLPDAVSSRLEELRDGGSGSQTLATLFSALALWNNRSSQPVVLLVDEVDSATNNQVFLDFLAQLRMAYLNHEEDPSFPAFQSVILAGVTDIKHLKTRIRPENESKMNSPWNIAADFDVDMSFSTKDVAGMLAQYEADHVTGMDIYAVAEELVACTSGYPFLVSRLCQLIDVRGLGWDHAGVNTAVRELLKDDDVSLFESLTGKLETYPGLKGTLRSLLMNGEDIDASPYDETQKQLRMFGFATERRNKLTIANRIFETLLYDYFLAEEQGGTLREAATIGRSQFVRGGRLDMCAVLEGFRHTYVEVYGPPEEGGRFLEKDGRELFLMCLKPIINGTGNYYIEAQTRDLTRTDVIVDYAGERFVVELKIWRGPRHNEEGERQVAGYLKHFGLDVGYMLSFNFNKHKDPGFRRVELGGKVLWEETV